MPLQGYWPLTESTPYDHSGNGNDGTNNGATTGVTGILGTNAYDFDSTNNDYIDTGVGDSTIIGKSGLTINVWVKLDSTSSIYQSFVSNTSGGNSVFTLRIDTLNKTGVAFGIYTDIDGWNGGPAVDSITAGSWAMCTGTYNGEEWKIYINGEISGSGLHSGTLTREGATEHTVKIGTNGDASTRYLNGSMGDVRIYDHALTAGEVQHLYDTSRVGTMTSEKKTL